VPWTPRYYSKAQIRQRADRVSAPTRRGSLTTGQDLPRRRPRGAMTEAILEKTRGLPPFRVSSLEPPHPSSVRLQRGCARRRLTEDHIKLQGDKLLSQHLRPPGRAGLATKPEPMGSATLANTGPTRR